MTTSKADRIAKDLMGIFPFIYKRMLRAERELSGTDMRFQMTILAMLEHKGPQHGSAIGKRLALSKAYMSTLIKRLIDEGKAKRTKDPADGRAMMVSITPKGKRTLEQGKELIREGLMAELQGLPAGTIEELHASLGKAREIIARLQEEKQ